MLALLETDTELVLNLIQPDQVSLGNVPRAFRRFPYCNDVWRTGEGSNLRCDLRRITTLVSCCLKPLSHLS